MLIFGTCRIEEDEDVVQTAVSAFEFLDTIPQQLNAVNSLIIRNIH